ncbi:UNVERIFIED_CONTAM: hypothetical protein Sradi_6470400 [Sesamum radiatum]|uniref:Uncharacterized protein n=1 Tax=Sesamum radiatum TaxID=300843 RepID=A0AAW2K587_SESRA
MKKLVKNLGLPIEKIDTCKNGCMLYSKDDVDLEYCKFYGGARATAENMTWHATHQTKEGSMCHPSDAEAWKHFDRMYPELAEEPLNVQLGLCTYDFASHDQYGGTYSCWRLSLHRIIFSLLWHVGVRTYDQVTDRAFMMWAAFIWIVNDPTRLWNGVWVEYCGGYGMSDLYG